MDEIGRFTIPEGHPALRGHFPDNPVVPGVVLLDEVAALLAENGSLTGVVGVPRVKFVGVVRPGEVVVVSTATGRRAGRWSFVCAVADTVVAQGEFDGPQ